jgi:ATP-dependent RNA helicase DDX46/PRP5
MDNVITAEDVMQDIESPSGAQLKDNASFQEPSENDSEAEDEFHRAFMESLRKKEELERMNNSMGVNFEEDDFRFIADLEKQPKKQQQRTASEAKPAKVAADECMVVRKNLYIESKEITQLTEKQVKAFRKESGHIQVRGLNCPRPI